MALSVPDQVTPINTTIYLDSSGDLRLRVGPEQQNFVVCSKTMERSSTVWKTMLSGGFAKSRALNTDKEWVVTLPEDKPEVMLIVLNIIHSRFSLVPEKLTVMDLYDILALTENYNVTENDSPVGPSMDELRPKYTQLVANVDCMGFGRCDYVRRDGGLAGHEMHS